jgi:hypothetical protein
MGEETGVKRKLVRERIKRIVQSSDRSDRIIRVLIGTLLALILFLAGYYLIT